MSPRIFRALIGGVVLALITATTAFAGKPSSPSPTLSVSFPTSASTSTTTSSMSYGTPYVVSGCGYTSYVTIVVTSPEAIAFTGQTPDGSGCLSITNFSTQGPGHYKIEAWEQLRNKSSIVASTGFDVG